MNIFQKVTDFVNRDFSTFDMSNNWVGSVQDFGSLNKIYDSVVLPADRWKGGHNVIVKLPPLVAPAFTRIKGVINSFYVSYQSVWNYWNQFISNKPEDAYLTRGSLLAYNGKFVEPYVPMSVICYICKIAKGYFKDLQLTYDQTNKHVLVTSLPLLGRDPVSSQDYEELSHSSLTWTYTRHGRDVDIEMMPGDFSYDSPVFRSIGSYEGVTSDYDVLLFKIPYWSESVNISGSTVASTMDELAMLFGFANLRSWFVYQCQSVVRNLENSGVPCDLIAKSSYRFYRDDKFNLLPFMCDSYIWQEIYRDSQNQAPEFDYREVNGCICNPRILYYAGSSYTADASPYGWYLKLNGLPPNVSMSSTDPGCYFRVAPSSNSFNDSEKGNLISVLTGFLLKQVVLSVNSNLSVNSVAVNILPDYYNGLLITKYRNFEKDYFTSASIDPLMGGIPVNVPSTIDALRTASKFEEFLERWTSARDFVSFMQSSYGEKPRERYVKPVFLGSQVVKVQIGEQLQTSESSGSSPLGERAGVADGYGSSGTMNETFKEHGHVVSYLSFILDSQYSDGLPHYFMHHLQFDYPWPDFANLGAEMIPTSEIFYGSPLFTYLDNFRGNSVVVQSSSSVDVQSDSVLSSRVDELSRSTVGNGIDLPLYSSQLASNRIYVRSSETRDTFSSQSGQVYVTPFGYTPRYSRWKFKTDVVAGQMRNEMDYWHTFRQFSNTPHIGNSFVSYMNVGFTSNLNRIFAVENDNADKFYVSIFNNVSVRRCLPLVPSTSLN